jgi:type IV pilus assembly protein PilP
MTRRLWAGAFAWLAWVAVAALAQSQAPVRPVPAGPAAATPQAPPYSYNPEGRRDPFVSLLRRGTDTGRTQGRATEGVAGMLVNELVLKGIMRSRTHYVALVQGPDNKTYVVRVNDRLADGSVRAITADAMVLMQDVNDPLSATKQREVRKTLRAPVEQK